MPERPSSRNQLCLFSACLDYTSAEKACRLSAAGLIYGFLREIALRKARPSFEFYCRLVS
jgi:hypothetical protein